MSLHDDVTYLLKRAIPDALDPILRRTLGDVVPRTGDGGRYAIAYTGAFGNRVASDLLAFGRNQRLDGALVVVDLDAVRTIYFAAGRVVGADSNVIFERLGRVLARAGLADEAGCARLVALEEAGATADAAALVPPEAWTWAVERRVWEVAAALFFVKGGQFVLVSGAPDLGRVGALDLNAMDLALEGLRRYDEWRRDDGVSGPARPRPEPKTRPPEAPASRPPPQAPLDEDVIRALMAEPDDA